MSRRRRDESAGGAGERFELEIERLVAGGDGLGRAPDGRAVFVPLAVPGDRVRVRVCELRPRFLRAEIETLLEPGSARVTPRCAVFGRCGGCSWQQVAYAEQVAAKRAILRDAFERLGGHALREEPPFTASPEPYGYRARARVLAGDGQAGYRERGSHALCAVETCPVLAPELERALGELARTSRAGDALDEYELAVGSDGRAEHARAEQAGGRGGAERRIAIEVGGDVLSLSTGSFAQANRLLWGTLHARVVAHAGSGARLLELYAGGGFFTLALARRFADTTAVEAGDDACADLARNLRDAGLAQVRVLHARVEQILPRGVPPRPDVVVLDPPRAGVSERVTRGLAALAPARIVYLSCDPATLARDARRLVASGYALVHVEGFDLFPQTPHIEALAVLERA